MQIGKFLVVLVGWMIAMGLAGVAESEDSGFVILEDPRDVPRGEFIFAVVDIVTGRTYLGYNRAPVNRKEGEWRRSPSTRLPGHAYLIANTMGVDENEVADATLNKLKGKEVILPGAGWGKFVGGGFALTESPFVVVHPFFSVKAAGQINDCSLCNPMSPYFSRSESLNEEGRLVLLRGIAGAMCRPLAVSLESNDTFFRPNWEKSIALNEKHKLGIRNPELVLKRGIEQMVSENSLGRQVMQVNIELFTSYRLASGYYVPEPNGIYVERLVKPAANSWRAKKSGGLVRVHEYVPDPGPWGAPVEAYTGGYRPNPPRSNFINLHPEVAGSGIAALANTGAAVLNAHMLAAYYAGPENATTRWQRGMYKAGARIAACNQEAADRERVLMGLDPAVEKLPWYARWSLKAMAAMAQSSDAGVLY